MFIEKIKKILLDNKTRAQNSKNLKLRSNEIEINYLKIKNKRHKKKKLEIFKNKLINNLNSIDKFKKFHLKLLCLPNSGNFSQKNLPSLS